MKEKLELKHLSAYLPYGLKMCDKNKEYSNYLLFQLSDEHFMWFEPISESYEEFMISEMEYKPILYPLNYLTKPIWCNGEEFVPMQKLANIYNDINQNSITSIDFHNIGGFTLFGLVESDSFEVSIPLWGYEKMFEWKIDVFGLIDKGLAIPVTDDFNPYK